jgi:hypothetical protein
MEAIMKKLIITSPEHGHLELTEEKDIKTESVTQIFSVPDTPYPPFRDSVSVRVEASARIARQEAEFNQNRTDYTFVLPDKREVK